jgi:hypothetical protein
MYGEVPPVALAFLARLCYNANKHRVSSVDWLERGAAKLLAPAISFIDVDA